MKVKELINELEKYDGELDIEICKIYKTKRVEGFDAKKIVPCKNKVNKEIKKIIIII